MVKRKKKKGKMMPKEIFSRDRSNLMAFPLLAWALFILVFSFTCYGTH